MERLTEWNGGQTRHAYYPRCFKEPCYGSGCKIKDCPFETAVCERLAAYEDTGLEPEAVETVKLALAAKHMVDLETLNNTPISRLVELAEADKDGRVVVLPCKVGDTLWVTGRDNVPRSMALEAPDIRTVCTDEDNLCMSTCNRKPGGFCAYRLRNDGTDIGKTVFLTREEAERAMQEMEGKKDGNETSM